MFHGLSAFPLTPLKEGTFDEHAFINLLRPVVDAGVDSLGILGSTGSYAYLTVEKRGRIARCAVAHADDIPVIVSIGALRLDDILRLADDAQSAGVSGVLLAPVSYQRLTEDEVFHLYETVTRQISVPLCIYDNPATTGFSFSDELLFAAAALPNIGSIKLGRVPEDLAQVRARLPDTVTLASPVTGERPPPCRPGLTSGTRWSAGVSANSAGDCRSKSRHNPSGWSRFGRCSAIMVVCGGSGSGRNAGKVETPALPFPLQAIQGEPREALAAILADLVLA